MRAARRWLRHCVASALAVFAAASPAAPALDDGPDGMSCQFYVAAARLPWQRPGGDWEDADGTRYGERAFARDSVGAGAGSRTLRWDLTALARRWLAGTTPAGAVMLRAEGGSPPANVVNLRSREHADVASRPLLEIEWDDGQRDRLDAAADTFFACPTYKSSGGAAIIKVSADHAALLVFALPAHGKSGIRRASLLLNTDKVYGKGLAIGAFQPLLPDSAPDAAPRGLAQAFRGDVGIAAHPDVLFADRFDRGRNAAAWSGTLMSDAHTLDTDAAERFEAFDGKALKVTIERGKNQGLNNHYRFAANGRDEPDEAYFRYYLRFGESWNPDREGGKLPGLSGTYERGGWGMRPADGRNGWSARGAFFKQATVGPESARALRGIGSYVYHADLKGGSGTTWGWGLGPSGLLQKNRWYSVEQQVRLNRPGASDGELRAWVDGALVFEKTGLRFRDVPELKIESVWMNVYHGGTAVAPADLTLFIDNVVIARRYIGPVGGGR